MKRIVCWWGKLSLRGKLIASIVVPSLIVFSIMYYYSTQSIVANFDREYQERALVIGRVLQQDIRTYDFAHPDRIQTKLQNLVDKNDPLYRISVYVPDGKGGGVVLVSSDPSLVGQQGEPSDFRPLLTGQPELEEDREEDNVPLMEANVPLVIGGTTVGTIGVYVSLSTRDALIRSQQTDLIVVGGGGLLLTLLLVYFLTERLVIRPVARISRAASRIATGELDAKLPQLGSDEVGQLASSVGTMVDELLRERQTLEQLATTDGLTELWNHRYFYERLRQEVNRSLRAEEPLAVIMFDLDRFKAFNDAHGHVKGDEVLRIVGRIMRTSVRPYDVPCRYGGEEFTVIAPGSTSQGAREIAERIRLRIAAEDFPGDQGQKIPLSASFGVSSFPADASSPSALIKAADAALYAAKRAGGNTIRVYDQADQPDVAEERVSLEGLFKEANLGALQAMARAADARATSSGGHSTAVTGYARRLGTALGLDAEDVEVLEVAALLHDVGKIGIPESILSKPGALSDKEWEIVRTHPVIGELMIKRVPSLSQTLMAVLHHHERWDGTGYPDGLNGEAIPLFARMLSIADAYEAMTSSRPYRRALRREQALEEIEKGSGSQFDPRLVQVFVGLMASSSEEETEGLPSGGLSGGGLKPVVNIDPDQDDDHSGDRDIEGAHDLA